MKINRVLLLFLNFLIVSTMGLGCSESESNKELEPKGDEIKVSNFSAQLPFEKLQIDNCLSLEKLQNHLADSRFHFESRKTTITTEIDNNDSRFIKSNFGIDESPFKSLPRINQIKQGDCSTVEIQNSYGRWLKYTITQAEKKSLQIEYDPSLPEDLSEAEVETFKNEPELQSLLVEIIDPFSIKYSYKSETISFFCNPNKTIPYHKTLLIRWKEPGDELSETESINREYLQKMIELVENSGGSTEEMEDLPNPENFSSLFPLQTPDVVASSPSNEFGFETLQISYEQIKELQEKLREVRISEICPID